MRVQIGPWLADVAANVLVITVIALIAMARLSSSAPPATTGQILAARPTQPVDGAEAVELLRLRLLAEDPSLVDVPLTAGALPQSVSALLVLDSAGYPAVAATLSQRQSDWIELTVPDALKTPENAWDPAFLDLAQVAADPGLFRSALQQLLTERAQVGRGSPTAGLDGTGLSTSVSRWVTAFLNGLGLVALAFVFWVLLRIRRWSARA